MPAATSGHCAREEDERRIARPEPGRREHIGGFGNKGRAVSEGLIIVESPAKARTLKRFLGDRFNVLASMGHVRDLPEKELGVDVEKGFKPHYQVVDDRQKTITDLRAAVKKDPGDVILASDPDRQAEADELLRKLEGATYKVIGVEKKRRTKSSYLPYITSTMQQDASSRLRFRPRNTMRVAQQLYEGIELGAEGATGLITYMRTDSTRISDEAEQRVKGWIADKHGSKYIGGPRAAKSAPGAQDAHEAIRPTDVNHTPESIREHLTPEQFKLYDLIWRRFVASRMAPAVYDQTQVEIEAGEYIFRATGSVLAFDGFYAVWPRDEDAGSQELPALADGEALDFHGLKPEQHFSQPPPRYTEATLIKELEQRGIGRPSTYAPIVETITKDHGYVEIKERRLHPTQIGEAVNSIMVDRFKVISDDEYTATLEKRLDQVESGSQEWVPDVSDFYGPLQKMLSSAEKAMPADTDEVCPLCHEGHLVLKASRFGPFMGCSRYPKCKFRRALTANGEASQPKLLEEPCPA